MAGKFQNRNNQNPGTIVFNPEILGDVIKFTGVINSLPNCFYGKYSRFGMSISMQGKLQMHIAEANDPDAPRGKVARGTQVYNNDTKVDFSIDSRECHHIIKNIKSIMDGSYVDVNEKNDKYKNTFKLNHFDSNSNMSSLSLVADSKGRLKITLKPSNPSAKALQYAFTEDSNRGFYERSMFLDMVKYVASQAPAEMQMMKAKLSILKSAIFEFAEKFNLQIFNQGGNGGNPNGNASPPQQRQGYQNQPPQQRQRRPEPEPEPDEYDGGYSDDDDPPFDPDPDPVPPKRTNKPQNDDVSEYDNDFGDLDFD